MLRRFSMLNRGAWKLVPASHEWNIYFVETQFAEITIDVGIRKSPEIFRIKIKYL